ncbi:MAG: SOS response-associated peptidase [SAR324 cluster bacterium]|nr:SOS response-associated peptidase [SAR324 cluster bacterium]
MCGRFSMQQTSEKLIERFEIENSLFTAIPRYNIAPSQIVPIILDNGTRYMDGLKWGLVPSWSKDKKIGNKLINARAETLAEKPSFRNALKRRRCIIPASGFFEWKKEGDQRIPTYIHLKKQKLFAIAGLWEEWQHPDGSMLLTFTIITVAPNHLMETIHNRMPAILKPEEESIWLDPSIQNKNDLQKLLQPYPEEIMETYTVSRRVNSPANDDTDCIKPV